MEKILSEKLNVLRTGSELAEAVEEVGDLLEELDNSSMEGVSEELAFATLRLVNDLQTTYLLAMSAYTREESCGCHVRTDHEEEGEEKYRVVVQNTPDGLVVFNDYI